MDASNIEQALTPDEAAKFLNISVQKLARLRRQGKVQGTQVGNSNIYIYTISNLRKADLSKEKRGPKPKKQDTDIVQN
jgi:excisionase family DNA binding protein